MKFLLFFSNCFSYSVALPNGNFGFAVVITTGSWVHAVMNFIGPDEGQGIRIYNDGRIIGSDTTKTDFTNSPSDGRIVIGRVDFDANSLVFYASVEVDELLIFNRTLTEPEIILLNQNPI